MKDVSIPCFWTADDIIFLNISAARDDIFNRIIGGYAPVKEVVFPAEGMAALVNPKGIRFVRIERFFVFNCMFLYNLFVHSHNFHQSVFYLIILLNYLLNYIVEKNICQG